MCLGYVCSETVRLSDEGVPYLRDEEWAHQHVWPDAEEPRLRRQRYS